MAPPKLRSDVWENNYLWHGVSRQSDVYLVSASRTVQLEVQNKLQYVVGRCSSWGAARETMRVMTITPHSRALGNGRWLSVLLWVETRGRVVWVWGYVYVLPGQDRRLRLEGLTEFNV